MGLCGPKTWVLAPVLAQACYLSSWCLNLFIYSLCKNEENKTPLYTYRSV